MTSPAVAEGALDGIREHRAGELARLTATMFRPTDPEPLRVVRSPRLQALTCELIARMQEEER